MTTPTDLSAEDAKLVTLARGARGRIGAREGAAVRDEVGRTYSAASIDLPSLRLSAIQLAVAQAVGAGARSLEAVALLSDTDQLAADDIAVVADLGGAPIIRADR